MTDVIFALSRTDYYHQRSYADYLRLIELSGYSTCYFDEMDIHDPTRCYILSPYDPSWGGYPDVQARLIWYDLEWRLDTPFPDVPGISEVWIADKSHAERTGKKYVPLGSHPGLKLDIGERNGDKRYDVILLAYMTNRRQYIADRLRERNVTIAPQGWDGERHAALCQSMAMLHVHQHDDIRTVAPQRWAIAAAYSLPLITETLDDRGLFGYSDFLMSDYNHLAEFAQMWTRESDRLILENHGHALHQRLCVEFTFRKCIEAAL